MRLGIIAALIAIGTGLLASDLTTGQNDASRTAAATTETILNTSNVSALKFGKVATRSVDGHIYAQPLYAQGVGVGSLRRANVVYVATMHNTVYAFDADSSDSGVAAPYWQRNLGAAVPGTQEGYVQPEIGILSTPVLEPSSGTLFVVAATSESGTTVHRLHALDMATGAEKLGGPVVVTGAVPGTGDASQNGSVTFQSSKHLQRTALLLANNSIYVAFAGYADTRPFHGWIMAYNARTLRQTAVFATTPNGSEGGVWQSGVGLAADSAGNIYGIAGNGDYDGAKNFGSSFLKLNAGLALLDWFTPANWLDQNGMDWDLGSTGPLAIPETSLIAGGSKEGYLYLLDGKNLGHLASGSSGPVQRFIATIPCPKRAWDGCAEMHHLAYWNKRLYVWGWRDKLKSYAFSNGRFTTAPASTGAQTAAYFPGGVLSISADGARAGTGIVWAVTADGDTMDGQMVTGVLHAIDADDLTHELWNSNQTPRNSLGNFAKFVAPTVANGKVYMATASKQLTVYGLR